MHKVLTAHPGPRPQVREATPAGERKGCAHELLGFPGGSAVKDPPTNQEMRVQSQGRDDPMEEEMATHSTILPWKISWTEEPGHVDTGPQGHKKSQTRLKWLNNKQQETIQTPNSKSECWCYSLFCLEQPSEHKQRRVQSLSGGGGTGWLEGPLASPPWCRCDPWPGNEREEWGLFPGRKKQL